MLLFTFQQLIHRFCPDNFEQDASKPLAQLYLRPCTEDQDEKHFCARINNLINIAYANGQRSKTGRIFRGEQSPR